MDKQYYTVEEIAKMFGVTTMGVRHWINAGLPYRKEKVIGVKTRIIIDPKDVEEYHNNKAAK